jgi:hypothetical protein
MTINCVKTLLMVERATLPSPRFTNNGLRGCGCPGGRSENSRVMLRRLSSLAVSNVILTTSKIRHSSRSWRWRTIVIDPDITIWKPHDALTNVGKLRGSMLETVVTVRLTQRCRANMTVIAARLAAMLHRVPDNGLSRWRTHWLLIHNLHRSWSRLLYHHTHRRTRLCRHMNHLRRTWLGHLHNLSANRSWRLRHRFPAWLTTGPTLANQVSMLAPPLFCNTLHGRSRHLRKQCSIVLMSIRSSRPIRCTENSLSERLLFGCTKWAISGFSQRHSKHSNKDSENKFHCLGSGLN